MKAPLNRTLADYEPQTTSAPVFLQQNPGQTWLECIGDNEAALAEYLQRYDLTDVTPVLVRRTGMLRVLLQECLADIVLLTEQNKMPAGFEDLQTQATALLGQRWSKYKSFELPQ